MRTLPTADARVYAVRDRTTLLKVVVSGVDLTNMPMLTPGARDWVESVSYSANLDQPVSTAELRIRREEGYLSLAPLNANSKMNNLGGTLSPIIKLRALVVISAAVVPIGHDRNYADTNSLWREVFRGRIDSWDASANPITVRCRDISCDAQDLFIETARIYAVGKRERGVGVWQYGETVELGEWRVPTQMPELGTAATVIWECTTAGTCSSTAEPAWTTSPVTDGTAVWTALNISGAGTWTPGSTWDLGDAVSDGGHTYLAVPLNGEPDGTTGATEPTWPTAVGGSVDDGGVRWIMVPDGTDGGMSIEAILLGLHYDNTTLQDIDSIPLVWTPVSPGYWRNPMQVQQQSLLEAMRSLAQEIGWDVRLRYNGTTTDAAVSDWGKWRLCLMPPDRAKTAPDLELTEDQYEALPRLQSSADGVRTRVRVVYSDYGDLAADGTPRRKSITVVDSAAEATFGRRFMELAAGSSNGVNSAAEATALANAVLSDVSDPGLEADVSGPYLWHVELTDLILLAGDWTHFTGDQQAAVYGYTHEFSAGKAKTTLQLRGKPSIGLMRWLELQVIPGVARPITGPAPAGPVKGTVVVVPGVQGGTVKYKPPRGAGTSGKPPGGGSGPGEWQETELHLSTSSGFTPSSSTLVAQGRSNSFTVAGRTPGVPLYGRLVMRDGLGNESARSDQFSFTPSYILDADVDPLLVSILSAALSTAQVDETGGAQLEFDTAVVDTAGGFDDSGFLYVVPADGYYEVRCAVALTGLSSGDVAGLLVTKNSGLLIEAPRVTASGSAAAVVAAGLVYLERNDEIAAELDVTTSGTVTVQTTSRLEIRRVLSPA